MALGARTGIFSPEHVMIKELTYKGWNALSLSSDEVELVVPLDIGTRVISCARKGKKNLFCNVPEQMGGKNEPKWLLRGGHRLWHSPEDDPRSYELDNSPIQAKRLPGDSGLRLTQPLEPNARIQKTITVEVIGPSSFKLTHTIKNENQWPIQVAPWTLTVLEHGGYATIPLLPKGKHPDDLLPGFFMVPWAYTDLSLPLWNLHRDFIGMDTGKNTTPQKLGLSNYPGWSAYWQQDGTFVKYAEVQKGVTYPDFGCCFETFCNSFMIELETLGALTMLEPGKEASHVEYWGVFGDLPRPDTDAAYAKTRETVEKWLSQTVKAK